MKILLLKDVSGLGRAGDIKEVSDGHARNFLMPKKLAVPATQSLIAHSAKEAREKQEKSARDEQKLKDLMKQLNQVKLVIRGKASKDHLFAAIHESQIAQAIKDQLGIEINPKQIVLAQAIKNLGPATAELRFGTNLKAVINLDIQAQ